MSELSGFEFTVSIMCIAIPAAWLISKIISVSCGGKLFEKRKSYAERMEIMSPKTMKRRQR